MSIQNDKFIINPYIAGSPVKDQVMFFGRDDVYAWLRDHLQGQYQDNAIVLYGERRTGKTSVLYHMKHRLDPKRYVPVLLDLQGMGLEGLDGFLWEIARKILLGLRGIEGMHFLDRPRRRDFEDNPRDYFENHFLPPIIAALGHRRLLLMFDETTRLEEKVQEGELPTDVFTYLRALIQQVEQINFIFSIGNRAEELLRGTNQLFNLAVYRKISFLDQDFAEDLITGPVAQYYSYSRAAIDYILSLTAGQPYYTQLICHNLFTRWAETKKSTLEAEDVETVLSQVLEQSTPNLQFIWYSSNPEQKVILSTLATILPHYRGGVMRRNLDKALNKANLFPPRGDVTNGLKRLFERDLINNNEPYTFRIGLLQHWLREFQRPEWVYEELDTVAKEWERREQQRLAEAPTPIEHARRWIPVLGGVVLGILIVLVPLLFGVTTSNQDEPSAELLTRVAQLQIVIETAESSSSDDPIAHGTAQSVATTAAAALTRVAEAGQLEGTATAAANQAVHLATQAAQAQATAESMELHLNTLLASSDPTSLPPPPPPTPPLPPPPSRANQPSPTPTVSSKSIILLPTATPTPSPSPTFSPTSLSQQPQGHLAVPINNGAGSYDVYIYSLPEAELLTQIQNARQPDFHKQNGQLLISRQTTQGEQIQIYDFDEKVGKSITRSSTDSHPNWAPDGEHLVYNNRDLTKDGQNVWRIFVQSDIIGASTNKTKMLAGDILDADSPLYPLWSEEENIIFHACNYWSVGQQGQCGIWRTSPAATENGIGFRPPQNITSQKEIPTDSFDRFILAMGQQEINNWEVYLISLEENNIIQNLSNYSGIDGLATFSPDGQWVAFVSYRENQWGIWVIPTAGGEAERLPIEGLRFGSGNQNWTTERISWGP